MDGAAAALPRVIRMHATALAVLLCVVQMLSAQTTYPVDAFRSPVDIPIVLSGTFGEPRSTHFHAGIDIKTQGVVNKRIYAIADGWVSRVKVSPYGYGKVLYITHPNGFTSVYAHLNAFSDSIQAWVRDQQYRLKQNEIDIDSIPDSVLVVRQGEVIARSGNTGGSGGPHLHFEIRDSLEQAINPLFFGYEVADSRPPTVSHVMIYDRSEGGWRSPVRSLRTQGSGESITLGAPVVVDRDAIGIGVHTYDRLNGAPNKNGIFGIRLYVDDSLIYHYQMGRFAFSESRYRHGHMDYALWREQRQSVHRCHRLPGNRLRCYPDLRGDGLVRLAGDAIASARLEVYDFAGNVSTVRFTLSYDASESFFDRRDATWVKRLEQGRSHAFRLPDVELKLPRDALFDDVFLTYERRERDGLSDAHVLHDPDEPLFREALVRVRYRPMDSVPTGKLLMVYEDDRGRRRSLGGIVDSQYVRARTKAFGTFYVDIDTTPPTIRPLNISEGKTMTWQDEIRFRIGDDLSGIREYDLFINGTWVPVYFDYKIPRLTYTIDDTVVDGENTLDLVVRDERGNGAAYSATFTY